MDQSYMPVWLSTFKSKLENGASFIQIDTNYQFHLLTSWQGKLTKAQYAGLEEHIYRGESNIDWLSVTHMKTAVPGHDMEIWVDSVLQLIGFPDSRMARAFSNSTSTDHMGETAAVSCFSSKKAAVMR